MKLSLIHPSRSRPDKSVATIDTWLERTSSSAEIQLIVSVDEDDPTLELYKQAYNEEHTLIINKNRSCVDAINNAAKVATGDILIVVSDDTDCKVDWDVNLLVELQGKSDFLLKTDDGIQDYIVTMTVMDRTYYQRDGYIYHPDIFHQFADTYLTCLADIRGRLIFSKLSFPHLHPGHSGGKLMSDALNRRNDLSWMQGQDTFIRLMKQFSREELGRIKDKSMINWLRNFGKIAI